MAGILLSKIIRPCKFYRVYFFSFLPFVKIAISIMRTIINFKEGNNMFKKISKILSLMATGMNYSSQYIATGGADAKLIHLNT